MSPRISQPERTMTRPRRYAVGAMALLVTLPLAVGTVGSTVVGTATAAQAGRPLPERIGARPGVHQMITVTSANWQTSTATLRAWQRRADGSWRLARGPVRAVVGYSGWVQASKRVQATGTTPAGRFRLPYAFGRLADPGANLRYRHFDRNDWWPYEPRDPATYNVWQWRKATKTHWRANKAEHLWNYGDQYAYGRGHRLQPAEPDPLFTPSRSVGCRPSSRHRTRRRDLPARAWRRRHGRLRSRGTRTAAVAHPLAAPGWTSADRDGALRLRHRPLTARVPAGPGRLPQLAQ